MEQATKEKKGFFDLMTNELFESEDFKKLDSKTQQELRSFKDSLSKVNESLFSDKRKRYEDELEIAATVTHGTDGVSHVDYQGMSKGKDVRFSFSLVTADEICPRSAALQIVKMIFNDLKKHTT